MFYYTYVLKCFSDNGKTELYIGYTTDLKKRLADHKTKSTRTTQKFRQVILIYYEACLSKTDARKRELQLKTGFGRNYIKKRLDTYLNKRD